MGDDPVRGVGLVGTVDAHDAPDELTIETLAEAERWAREKADALIATR